MLLTRPINQPTIYKKEMRDGKLFSITESEIKFKVAECKTPEECYNGLVFAFKYLCEKLTNKEKKEKIVTEIPNKCCIFDGTHNNLCFSFFKIFKDENSNVNINSILELHGLEYSDCIIQTANAPAECSIDIRKNTIDNIPVPPCYVNTLFNEQSIYNNNYIIHFFNAQSGYGLTFDITQISQLIMYDSSFEDGIDDYITVDIVTKESIIFRFFIKIKD